MFVCVVGLIDVYVQNVGGVTAADLPPPDMATHTLTEELLGKTNSHQLSYYHLIYMYAADSENFASQTFRGLASKVIGSNFCSENWVFVLSWLY